MLETGNFFRPLVPWHHSVVKVVKPANAYTEKLTRVDVIGRKSTFQMSGIYMRLKGMPARRRYEISRQHSRRVVLKMNVNDAQASGQINRTKGR